MTVNSHACSVPISASVGCHCQGDDRPCYQHRAIAKAIQAALDEVLLDAGSAMSLAVTFKQKAEARVVELEALVAAQAEKLRGK